MSFANPFVLVLACLCPFGVFGLYMYDRARRAQLTHRLGELPVIARVIASASPGRRAAKAVLAAAGLTLILVALARPQIRGERRVEMRGLDVVVAMDVSKSMLVDDVGATEDMTDAHVHPTRLARARELATALIDGLPGDRIGPVVFAGAAVHFPLTEDQDTAERFLSDLGPTDLPPGSNLAEAFRVARCLLRPDLYDDLGCARMGRRGHGGDPLYGERDDTAGKDDDAEQEQEERGKAIVLFTDGGDDGTDAVREAATARELGIAVIVVGLGTPAGGVVHEVDDAGNPTATPKHTRDGQTVVSKRDDEGMKALAAAAGDERRFVVASVQGEVDPAPILAALRGVTRGVATKKIHEHKDLFQIPLFAGFLLLVIEAAISTRRRVTFPEEH